MYLITSPLKVEYSRDKEGRKRFFSLNLNVYRNTHYYILNQAKKSYEELIREQIKDLPKFDSPIEIIYTIYPSSNRKFDLMNVGTVVDKFFCDALVQRGKLIDDDYSFIKSITVRFGAVDKLNPRCEILLL